MVTLKLVDMWLFLQVLPNLQTGCARDVVMPRNLVKVLEGAIV